MPDIVLNALEYQNLIMQLPNPSIHKENHALPRFRLLVPEPEGRMMYIQEKGFPPATLSQVRVIEFELVFNRPIPYWQPVETVVILPVQKEF